VSDQPEQPARPPRTRSDTREALELRALKEQRPELAGAADMHLALLELQRRVQSRIPLPWFELSADRMTLHVSEARPLLRFEDIPLDLTDLRLLVRQTAEVLQRFGALEEADFSHVQALGRDMRLVTVAGAWYRRTAERHAKVTPVAVDESREPEMVDEVLALAMRPFLSRCAEVLQPRAELAMWTHSHCALCGGEPDLAVITPAAERHLICGRCTLRWNFAPLTCPYCANADRTRITSFATPDGMYRVYACDVCQRYLKAYDARRASRPVMPVVDLVATLPLDAAAMQRGYTS
jgi:hypothetical protein